MEIPLFSRGLIQLLIQFQGLLLHAEHRRVGAEYSDGASS